jgi:formylglycine-generating enzyme required for sulfatase activity
MSAYEQYLDDLVRQCERIGLQASQRAQSAGHAAESGAAAGASQARGASSSGKRRFGMGEVFRDDFHGAPEMVVLPTGEFWMGSAEGERERVFDEGPRHLVHIDYQLAVGKYPVTFDEWEAFVADGGTQYRPSDSTWGRARRPVINVSWRDVQDYVAWLSVRTGQRYRLLSEAEWEYAARAGQGERRFPWGDDTDARLIGAQAWYSANSGGRTRPVGEKPANAFGLHDMHGNVNEWVEDVYQGSYDSVPADGRPLNTDGIGRVLRGGSWLDNPRYVRSASRQRFPVDYRAYTTGFRVARVV